MNANAKGVKIKIQVDSFCFPISCKAVFHRLPLPYLYVKLSFTITFEYSVYKS